MEAMLICGSHSPLLAFPAKQTPALDALAKSIQETRARVEAFDPELIILLGSDHYGGHQMVSMPAFCVGVQATAIADVGGTAGALNVPEGIAVGAVKALRESGVDVAVSYAMDVDHGFSQILDKLAGGLARYPVLPIFVSCLQPPFVPFKRARALGAAVASYVAGLGLSRVLLMGTGGLSHHPEQLFPSIDNVSPEWRPYTLFGKRQNDVPQQSWIDYEIDMHQQAAQWLVEVDLPDEALFIREDWDRSFLEILCAGDLATFDGWQPEDVVSGGGFGAMEILSWIAATQAMSDLTGQRPQPTFHKGIREIGISFAIAETAPAQISY